MVLTLFLSLLNLFLVDVLIDLDALFLGLKLSANDFFFIIIAVTLSGAVCSFLLTGFIARFVLGIRVLAESRSYLETWLFSNVSRQSIQLEIQPPRIGIYYSSDLNAFTCGWGKQHSMLVVSSGLLENLKQEELEAVIGHELAHIENGDMVSLSVTQGMLISLTLLPAKIAGLLDRYLLRRENYTGPLYYITYWFFMLMVGLLPHLLVMWFSRSREYQADGTSALINGNDKMIMALEALSNNVKYNNLPEQVAALGITGGIMNNIVGRADLIKDIFSSHPPLLKRISALGENKNTSGLLD